MIEKRKRSHPLLSEENTKPLKRDSEDKKKKTSKTPYACIISTLFIIACIYYYFVEVEHLFSYYSISSNHKNIGLEISAKHFPSLLSNKKNPSLRATINNLPDLLKETKTENYTADKDSVEILIPMTKTNKPVSLILPLKEEKQENKEQDTIINKVSILETKSETVIRSPMEEKELDISNRIDIIRKKRWVDAIDVSIDPNSKILISELQDKIREVLHEKYNDEPLFVEMELQFPSAMHVDDRPDKEMMLIQLAPAALQPYSIYYFLDILKTNPTGAFHRNAFHVQQALVNDYKKSLAFQEYNPAFPHVKHSFGFGGRPGGPSFYVSTIDNTKNHGPGSGGAPTEADSCFAKLVPGYEDVVERIQRQPGAKPPVYFVEDKNLYINILSMRLLTKEEWEPKVTAATAKEAKLQADAAMKLAEELKVKAKAAEAVVDAEKSAAAPAAAVPQAEVLPVEDIAKPAPVLKEEPPVVPPAPEVKTDIAPPAPPAAPAVIEKSEVKSPDNPAAPVDQVKPPVPPIVPVEGEVKPEVPVVPPLAPAASV